MDKRKNKILVGCLALLLVMAVGYALFSENITINGTATAKGDFELTTEVIDAGEEIYSSIRPLDPSTKGIVKSPTIVANNNIITTNVELGAPGSYHTFGIKVTNTGSIPAKLKSIEDITQGKVMFGTEDASYEMGYGVGEVSKNFILAELSLDSGWTSDYEDDITLRWPEGGFIDEMLDAVLDPGEEVYYFITYSWGRNSTEQGEPLSLNWQIKINWEQVTN